MFIRHFIEILVKRNIRFFILNQILFIRTKIFIFIFIALHRELRLIEVLEEACDGMSDYRIHKERKDSTRWAKQMSQTFKTLHGLVWVYTYFVLFIKYCYILIMQAITFQYAKICTYFVYIALEIKVWRWIWEYLKNYGMNHQLK